MVQILSADISHIDEILYLSLYQAASPDRQARADGYRNREDSIRCLVAEALLRESLQRVFGHWDGFPISYSEHGKPYLREHNRFHFSISHSGQWVVLAYGETELGVDIQRIDPQKTHFSVIKRFFTPEEQAFFSGTGSNADAFFKIWTGKESYLKYLGTGLSKSLVSFSVLSPEDGLHYFWEMLDGHMLCLCTQENAYRIEQVHIQNAPAW